jgi:GTPase SAR1 family protein
VPARAAAGDDRFRLRSDRDTHKQFRFDKQLFINSLPAMPFGEVVCGAPGSGKSTYCYGKHQLFTALNRPISIVNLDPANDNASLITLQDVMDEHGLGPNGGMLYCMEYLDANFDWLEARLKELGPDAYVLFDVPGQVELSTNHESLKHIVQRLTKIGFRVCSLTAYLSFELAK